MKPLYANLDELRSYLSLASQNDGDDDRLLGFLSKASRSIDRYTRRHFYPLRDTKYYDYKHSQDIHLGFDLLELDSFLTGGSAIPNGILLHRTGDDYNYPPYERLTIRSDSGSTFNYSGTDQKSQEVTGFWGYHEDYENAWVDTGTSLGSSYVAGASQITVLGGSTGFSDINWQAPRFSVGDTLKIGDEMFLAMGGNGASVNLIPHINGTSANHHASGTAVYKFSPEPDIQWTTIRLAGWLNGQGLSPYESKTAFFQIGTISIPTTWGGDIKDRMDRFVKPMIRTVP